MPRPAIIPRPDVRANYNSDFTPDRACDESAGVSEPFQSLHEQLSSPQHFFLSVEDGQGSPVQLFLPIENCLGPPVQITGSADLLLVTAGHAILLPSPPDDAGHGSQNHASNDNPGFCRHVSCSRSRFLQCFLSECPRQL
jgi:hypothetical protein